MVDEDRQNNEVLTPLQKEVKEIWAVIRAHDEVREVGVKLISMLKADVEGRESETAEKLNKRRLVFATLVKAIEAG